VQKLDMLAMQIESLFGSGKEDLFHSRDALSRLN